MSFPYPYDERHARTLRNPWWRFKRYCKLYGVMLVITVIVGWVTGGWNGIVVTTLTGTIGFLLSCALLEREERVRDKEWRVMIRVIAESIERHRTAGEGPPTG